MRPVPVVAMEEVIAQLSERGKVEWEWAVSKAQLVKALADPSEVPAESGHVPEANQLTSPE